MAKERETRTYDLLQGNKVVYRGTTNDLDKREQEHRDGGKKFTGIRPTSRKMTDEGAKQKV